MREETEIGPALMAEAAALLEAAVDADETWEWEATPDEDGGQVDSSKGGVVVFVPPFANYRTAQKHRTTYDYHIARLVAATPRIIRGLLKELRPGAWRVVARSAGHLPGTDTITRRLEVTGGWLYETTYYAQEGRMQLVHPPQVVFVPKAPQ